MSKEIKISKGLDIHLMGEAKQETKEFLSPVTVALKPLDYIGITPKLLVNAGDRVEIGTPVFYSKEKPNIKFVSPVSGEVQEVKRGEKRVIQEIIIKNDGQNAAKDFGLSSLADMSKEDIKSKMLESGLWTLLRQRPYDVIPNEESLPKYIILKGFESSPLAPDYNYILKGEKAALQLGIDVLKKLTEKTLYLSLNPQTKCEDILSLQNVEKICFKGKHPYGNVSVQAEKISPINKGERIWYISLLDVLTIGQFFLEGKYNPTKTIALTGEETLTPCYYRVVRGTCIEEIVQGNVNTEKHLRYISGNVLTGTRIEANGYLGAFDNQITVIEEGDYKEGLGWVLPGFKKFSVSHTFPRGFFARCSKKPFSIDSNMHGGERAYVFTGEFERVFPMDIYPLHLIKACLTKDIDKMEELGIYEVDAEDFALCEVIDVSKTAIQTIVRNGLELMRKELGE
ncbi:MAG: Na(+)-translocating NADH-quinone reductase subunit A [Bacteroidales bacterium]|nr:Na(+)-translocating NADH-quinone reductase subunit A [Bacteroidales bacterium]MDY6424119.1 Na(+)-translocating NADH-quinone reductase subunit A [Bacteroidales bacterium]